MDAISFILQHISISNIYRYLFYLNACGICTLLHALRLLIFYTYKMIHVGFILLFVTHVWHSYFPLNKVLD